MGGIETLFFDFDFHALQQGVGNACEDLLTDLLVALHSSDVAFNSSLSDFGAWLQVQCVLDVGSEQQCFVGLGDSPTLKVTDPKERDDRVQLKGWSSLIVTEMLTDEADGHLLQEHVAKEALPSVVNHLSPHGADDALERVEKSLLRR